MSDQIKGYRVLSPVEIEQINQVKELAEKVGAMVGLIEARALTPESKRWAAIGKTDLQKGFMALIRSVALPETF